MAGSSVKLGSLFVELLWTDGQFSKGAEASAAKLQKFGDSVTGITNGIAAKFELMLKVATGALTGLVAASGVVGAEFEQKITKVAVIAGGSVDELAEAARRMGASTQFSATEAATAMESLAQAGFATADIIGGTDAALALAAASGSDLAAATQIVASTMSQFALTAEDAGRIADVFTVALNTSQLNMSELTTAMSYAGTVGKSFGHTLEETTAAVAMFSNLGLEGSKAGTAFRMAMSQAATVSKAAEAALSRYGLTAKDINPELYNFGEILNTVGKAGITASDAMIIFGTEAGGNVAALAKQTQNTEADVSKSFDGILSKLRDSAGAAGQTATAMTQTVLGAWEQVTGAFEELLLSLFDTYRGPLRAALLEVAEFINEVAYQFRFASGAVSGDFGGALDELRQWLDRNGVRFATMIVIWTQRLIEVGTALSAIVPWLDEIAVLMAAVWAVNKIVAFVGVLANAYNAVLALQAGLAALGVELTALTGGLYAVVAVIGLVVAALVTYIAATDDASDAAERLIKAQERQRELDKLAAETQASAMARRLEDYQELARLELEAQRGTKIREDELRRILELDAATAELAVRKGELVEIDNELRTVESLVAQSQGPEDAQRLAEATFMLSSRKAVLAKEAANVKAKIDEVSTAMKRGEDVTGAFREAADGLAGVTSIAEAQARYQSLTTQIKETADAQTKLRNTAALASRAVADQAAEAARAAERNARSSNEFSVAEQREAERTAKKLTEERERAAEAARKALESVRDAAAEAAADELGLIRLKHDQEIRDLNRTLDQTAALWKDNADELAKIAAQRVEITAAIDRKMTFEIAAYWSKVGDTLDDNVIAPLGEVKTATAQITALGPALARSTQEAADAASAMLSPLTAARIYWLALRGIAGDVAVEIGKVGNAIAGMAQRVGGIVSTFTGFRFSLRNLASNLTEAAGNRSGFDAAGFARKFVTGLFEQADRFADLFVEAVPPALEEFSRGIPGLLQKVADSIPIVVQAVVDSIPEVTDALLDNLGPILEAIVDGIVDLVVAGLKELPDIIRKVIGEILPDLITSLSKAIPEIVTALVDAIPLVLDALVGALPPLISAIIDAIPRIVMSLVEAIPQIIISLVEAIPQLIGAILSQIPHLITMIIRLIPDIILSLADALPELIPAIIAMIPEIIFEIIAALPEIVFALVKGLVVDLIAKIPKIVWELVSGILESIGEIGKRLGEAIFGGIGSNPFTKEAEDRKGLGKVFGAIGDLFSGKGSGGGRRAYSGIEYVPAPMRVTLDKGEAVITADRNAQRLAGPQIGTAGAAQGFPSGPAAAAAIEVVVATEGRILEASLWRASAGGRAPQTQRAIRSATGVRVGIDRGRSAPYARGKRK